MDAEGLAPADRGDWAEDRPVPWQALRIPLVLAAFFLIEVVRRPETLTIPVFWNEDGRIFYAGALAGDPWWTPYQGYLHLVPRVAAWVETLVPSASPAFFGNLVAVVATVTVSAFIAGERMARLIPNAAARITAGLAVLLLPAIQELQGSVTYVQWWLALYLLLGAFAAPATGRWRAVDAVCLAVASLTGPFALFSAPFYWLRRDLRRSAVIVTVGAAVQLVSQLLSPHREVHGHSALLEILVRRLIVEPVTGALHAPQDIPVLPAIAIAILMVLCLRRLPVGVVLGGAAILAAGLFYSLETDEQLLSPFGAQRYFFVPAALITIAAVATAGRRELPGWILAGVMLVGVVADFRIAPH